MFHSLVDRTDFNGEAILLLQTLCKACFEVMECSQIILANYFRIQNSNSGVKHGASINFLKNPQRIDAEVLSSIMD